MNSPTYSYPPGFVIRVTRDIVLLRRRDFHEDAKACVANLHPPLRVWDAENFPQDGSCVLTINHYHRPGFGTQWLAFAVSALVPIHVHWVMTGEFMDWGKRFGAIGRVSSRILLKRIANIYGLTTMPPMPPRPGDVEARAVSVRAVLEYARRTKNAVIGLSPEGYDAPDGTLTRPASGVGRFALLLSRAGLTFCPVGAYEENGCFHVRFGERYQLSVRSDLSVDERDAQAIQLIMKNIACLLPSHLRGEFA